MRETDGRGEGRTEGGKRGGQVGAASTGRKDARGPGAAATRQDEARSLTAQAPARPPRAQPQGLGAPRGPRPAGRDCACARVADAGAPPSGGSTAGGRPAPRRPCFRGLGLRRLLGHRAAPGPVGQSKGRRRLACASSWGGGQLSQLGLPRDGWQVPSSRAPQKAVCSLREATAWPTVATGQTALPEQTCQPLWHKDILFLRWEEGSMETRVWPTFPDTCNSSATLAEVSQTTAAGLHRKDCTPRLSSHHPEALRGAEGRTRQMGNRLPRPRERYRPGDSPDTRAAGEVKGPWPQRPKGYSPPVGKSND